MMAETCMSVTAPCYDFLVKFRSVSQARAATIQWYQQSYLQSYQCFESYQNKCNLQW